MRAPELTTLTKDFDTPGIVTTKFIHTITNHFSEEITKLFPSLAKQGIKYISFEEKKPNPSEIKSALRVNSSKTFKKLQ